MESLEHFEDNLNTNITNTKLIQKFITHAKAVQSEFSEKFHNGEFKDPAKNLPKEEWILWNNMPQIHTIINRWEVH